MSILLAFTGGLLSFFSPCVVPLMPVYSGILLDADNVIWKNVLKTMLFIAGVSVVFLTLSFGFSTLGRFSNSDWFRILTGFIIIVLGLQQVELLRSTMLLKSFQLSFKRRVNEFVNVFLLGLLFSFAWTPCVGPILTTILTLMANGAGLHLMVFYILGFSLPFIGIALASSLFLKWFRKSNRYLENLKKVGGWVIVIVGVLLIFDGFDWFLGFVH